MPSIRLEVNVHKATFPGGGRRKVHAHTASVGALAYQAQTEKEACEGLEKLVRSAIASENRITCMFDLSEQTTVWIATGDAHGWSYRIVRRNAADSHYARESLCGGSWTREECLDRMRDHWYDCNAGEIVKGICSLAGWGHKTCAKCGCATRFVLNPTRCESPACGAPL